MKAAIAMCKEIGVEDLGVCHQWNGYAVWILPVKFHGSSSSMRDWG
jgi:hypothetical protein